MTHPEQTPPPADEQADELVDELVEEVSIDGMCGVY
ncbi:mycofactocin precursor MftA [Nocardioides psychrotolerans]|uniref:Mycofactocin n=1 Tax=Nocardioides psychrotolerans TaxID=1005945 RepID=A0A1I3BTH9_9ACTN|nr:mycofactocin precursor MftA [Nocardioides psychrotolerans]SFH65386.1 mycofactocin precursor [Nocardioides psychrotolerans]